MAIRFIGTRSLSQNAIDWLTNPGRARVLHVFDHACNLINERGEVLSIVTSQIGDGPFNLVIEARTTFSKHIDLESAVSIHPRQLTIGEIAISTSNAELWNSHPAWEILHFRSGDISRRLITFPSANSKSPGSPVSNISTALVENDVSAAVRHASQLAGLGLGLTPSGDDYMVGALHAAWIIHPREVAGTLGQAVAETAAPLTTSISAAWLRSAARGEAGIRWYALFDALISGDESDIQLQITNILSIGATSGADALAGFMDTFISYAKLKDHVIPEILRR